MTHELDHLLWGVPDLDEGIAQLADLVGVEPVPGGPHPGFGTRNALLSLGAGVYLEVIAPDPVQDLDCTRGEILVALPAPKLLTFAVRTSELNRVERLVEGAGLRTPGPVAMSRLRPDGRRLAWKVLKFPGNPFGESLPFFIDWGGSKHPSADSPGGCTLEALEVGHPDRDALADLYAALEIGVEVVAAPEPRMRAVVDTPAGRVTLGEG